MIRVESLTGAAIDAVIDDVARLRIAVFRDYPYLYDGDREYERRYLQTYRDSPGAVVITAFDGARIVGAATGTPLEEHADEFGAPFTERGFVLTDIFYCAESVLLSDYRGKGLGHAFFDRRENHARALARTRSTFCSVRRGDDHPAKPEDYRPLDGFWTKRGYAPVEGLTATFRWKDLGEDAESAKTLQFWMRDL